MTMDLLLIQNSGEEQADEALLAALNQHPDLRVHACRDLHKVRGLIAAHAPSAVILRPGPHLDATVSELKSQAPSLLCFVLLEASSYAPLADLLQDEDVAALPLEYVSTAYFPELVRQALERHRQRQAAPDESSRSPVGSDLQGADGTQVR